MTSSENLLNQIEYITVLMFENRSFDNILGALYPLTYTSNGNTFAGLPLNEVNYVPAVAPGTQPTTQKPYQVWTESPPSTDWTAMTSPNPDPGEYYHDMNQQIFGEAFYSGSPPNPAYMNGFADNYANILKPGNPLDIMHYFSPSQVPVSSALAQQYAVCDQWFASCPTQTFPNRLFSLCGTACGFVNDLEFVDIGRYDKQESIFQKLDSGLGISQTNWKVYHSSYSISQLLLSYLRTEPGKSQVVPMSQFEIDVNSSPTGLPPFSIIEPGYSGELANNSYHPPYNVTEGERFLWQIYNILQSNPAVFQKTLLVVTFDEHGGCYDHVPPPAALPPDKYTTPFNRYGVRVPTILISPLISPGQIFRASTSSAPNLDHTSIIRTVFDRFLSTDDYLLARDKIAPSFAGVLDLASAPYNPGSTVAEPPAPTPPIEGLKAHPSHLEEMFHTLSEIQEKN